MSITARPGAFPPFLQTTKHALKTLMSPGAKEVAVVAGKAQWRALLMLAGVANEPHEDKRIKKKRSTGVLIIL